MLKKLTYYALILCATTLWLNGCKDDDNNNVVPPEDKPEYVDPPAGKKIYHPEEFKTMDFRYSKSKWSYARSKASENFIVFWEAGYGSDPYKSKYTVNIDDLLAKAETFYDVNVNKLGFAKKGASNLDSLRMMIFLFYTDDWMAYGGGYDNRIGGLWISPSTCQPVGSTIAHEIGHSFQYQVFCDLGNGTGFRQAIGQGTGFWEQCAQWQSYQSYPVEAFASSNFSVFANNCHRHFLHEHQRYASYWMQWHWTDLHGLEMVGRIWRESRGTEDPLETYMRINNLSVADFNDQVYNYAAKCATWDFATEAQDGKTIRSHGENYIGAISWKSTVDNGYYKVHYDKCPEATGFNLIKLNVPEAGSTISTEFVGLPGDYGYNATTASTSQAGWSCGYVALLADGTRRYSDRTLIGSELTGTISWTVPANCSKLWLVVAATPSQYIRHLWDEDNTNDVQWPYKIKFSNTDLFGNITFDGTETPTNATIVKNVSFPANASAYSGAVVSFEDDIVTIGKSLVLQPSQIADKIGSTIKFVGVNSDGALVTNFTANGYGHWFDANGNVCAWGANAYVFSEFNLTSFTTNVGQYPGKCKAGDTYTIKQALVYEYQEGSKVQVTFEIRITITQ